MPRAIRLQGRIDKHKGEDLLKARCTLNRGQAPLLSRVPPTRVKSNAVMARRGALAGESKRSKSRSKEPSDLSIARSTIGLWTVRSSSSSSSAFRPDKAPPSGPRGSRLSRSSLRRFRTQRSPKSRRDHLDGLHPRRSPPLVSVPLLRTPRRDPLSAPRIAGLPAMLRVGVCEPGRHPVRTKSPASCEDPRSARRHTEDC
jgi:hypothetical protein